MLQETPQTMRSAAVPRPTRRCVEDAKARNAYTRKSGESGESGESGGDSVRIFKDLASWTIGTKVYIALRLCRTMAAGGKLTDVMNTAADVMNSDSEADVMNTALLGPGGPSGPSGPEEKSVQLPSLRSLAAARFLEFVVAASTPVVIRSKHRVFCPRSVTSALKAVPACSAARYTRGATCESGRWVSW